MIIKPEIKQAPTTNLEPFKFTGVLSGLSIKSGSRLFTNYHEWEELDEFDKKKSF